MHNECPEWLKNRFEAGNKFNADNRGRYEANEVEVFGEKKNFRVDSYNPGKAIVSRKYTQLAEIKESTAIGYLNELRYKYPSGATITNSPFNPAYLRGKTLVGQLYLEVPIQKSPIPQSILDAATSKNITIIDVAGKRWN